MKLVDEKGKLFGLINIVDLFVLLAALAVVAGVGYKLFAPQIKEITSPTVEMTVTARVRGASIFMQEDLQRNSQIGKQLVNGNEFVDATIENVELADYTVQANTADGRIVDATDPTKKDIIFTIKGKVTKDTPVPKIGTQEIRSGRTMTVKTNDFEVAALIVQVDIADS